MLVFDPKEESRLYHGVKQPSKNTEARQQGLEVRFRSCLWSKHKKFTTKDIIAFLMEGYNCFVFVYGATGAGKTFTMIGNIENPGIAFLTMERLLYTISSFEKEGEFDIAVCVYIEVYNENVYDLLNPSNCVCVYIEVYNENVYDLLNPSSTPLQLREDSNHDVKVAGLKLYNINTAPDYA